MCVCVWGGGITWGRMVGCNVCVCVGGGGITWGRMVGCNVCVCVGGGGGYNMGKDGWV